MKKYRISTMALILGLIAFGISSCTKDLDRFPTNSTTPDDAFSTLFGYKLAIAKVYGSLALTGSGGSGSSDLAGIDPGTSDFLRLYWNAQELPTDEAVCAWNDVGIPQFHDMDWTSSNVFLMGLYSRMVYSITVANSFLKQSTDSKLKERGITESNAVEQIKAFRAEARFIRAYDYWVLMDLYANPPFVTEETPIGAYKPEQIDRADLFDYIQSELKEIAPLLIGPRQNQYGRADRAADWALLARMYLNAETYTGRTDSAKAYYTEAIKYAQKVIGAGYDLMPDYQNLFLADNDKDNPEVILSLNYDGQRTQNYGGTTFLVNSAVGQDNMNPADYGIPSGGWSGNRSTKALVDKFHSGDDRALFEGNKKEIDDISQFMDGLAVVKFKNITSGGKTPVNASTFCSIDFPLFRLAEQYLIYAEAVLRGGQGGNKSTALGYINDIRERADAGDISSSDLDLDFILDERARELYWEGFRRTDLIRYGKFTSGSYLWPWKGGVKSGKEVDNHYKIYPIPSGDLLANTKLTQNPGY